MEKWSEENSSERKGVSRRGFLGSTLKGVAAYAVLQGPIVEGILRLGDLEVWLKESRARARFNRFHDLLPKEREKLIAREAETVGAFIRGPEGKRILEKGSDREIFRLLTLLPPILRDHIRGTAYDIPTGKWPSVALGVPVNGVPQVRGVSNSASDLRAFYRGNGVYIDRNTILTNWHVLQGLLGIMTSKEEQRLPQVAGLSSSYHRYSLDIVQIRMPPNPIGDIIEAPRVMKLKPGLKNSDVHGRLVTIAAIDPDETADPDGTKIYPSIAVRMTPRLTKFLAEHGPEGSRPPDPFHDPFLANSFLYLSPPGESLFRLPPSRSGSRLVDLVRGNRLTGSTYLHGTSGSPVVMNDQLVGLNHRLDSVEYDGLSIDLGFFQGPDEIRQATSIGMKYDAVEARDTFFKARRDPQGGYHDDYYSGDYSDSIDYK